MALLAVTPITKAGVPDISTALVAADAAGDSVNSSSGLFITLDNADAAPHTLTIVAPVATAGCGHYGELPVEDIAFVVVNGTTGFLTIPAGYSDGSGNFSWTYDAVTAVTVGVFSLSP